MNDLYCKDFEFLNADNQKAYENLKQTILKRSRLDLEFLQRFIEFSSECLGTVQYSCAKYAFIYDKNNSTMNFTDFCSSYLGLSSSTISKLYTTYERFIIENFAGEKCTKKTLSWILPEMRDMTLTKIFELLPISVDQLSRDFDKGVLSSNMTKMQLRAYVKDFKDGNADSAQVLEEYAEKDDEQQCRKTYDKIIAYIDFFKTTEESDPKQLKKLFVADLHSIKNALIKEFDLKFDD